MMHLRYLLAFIPSLLCVYGNLEGGLLSCLNIAYSMVLLPALEWWLPDDTSLNKSKDDVMLPTLILILLSFLHLGVGISLVHGVYTNKIAHWYVLTATLSSGINAGTNGIVVAHELIHRSQKGLRYLGIFNLVQVNYAHFYIEHIHGHHKYVGTQGDPATAKYNESIYQFVMRTIPGQFLSSLSLERKRLYERNKSQAKNFVIFMSLVQLGLMALLYLVMGIGPLLSNLLYSYIAVFLLEYVNYIEHYGLTRDEDKKFEAHHAWQSNKITSRFSLIELSRHADHHLKASKPYHTLEAQPGYYLPSGYYGMFYIALIPPLWFKLINPIIDNKKHKFD